MSEVFLKILNMSFVASWLILAVILLRLALKQAPKWITCLLWGMVAVRLLCPVSLESSLSLISNAEPITHGILMVEPPDIHEDPAFDPELNPILPDAAPVTPDTSIDQVRFKTMLAAFVWVIGMGVMLTYATVSYLRLRYKVRASLHLRDNIWLFDEIATPFLLGVLRPKIYIPSGVEEQHLPHIIAHENAHMKRRDHWWKLLGFLVLAIHWFNPLVWVAYTLLGRDIELACDEKVIRDLDKRESVAYSEALLSCSLGRRTILVCPLAFGEVGVKERVNRVLQYKKPTIWAVILASAVCVVIAVCFLTNPAETGSDSESSMTANGEPNEDSQTSTANEDIQSQNQDTDATSELVLETFPDDSFSISVDTSIWAEGSLDSGIYHWKGEDKDNFVEVGHMSAKPDIDRMIQLTLQRNGIEEMEIIEIPKDTPFTYAAAMEKENGYRLELYFTDKLQDETYFLVTCCYDPINDQMRDSTHELVFSFAMVETGNGIPEREAMVLAEEFLVANEITAPGLVFPDEPQQKNSLQRIVKTNIYGKKAYSMDLVFGPGPMNGRLIFSCAVSEDGKEFFIYDQATGLWNREAVKNKSSRMHVKDMYGTS